MSVYRFAALLHFQFNTILFGLVGLVIVLLLGVLLTKWWWMRPESCFGANDARLADKRVSLVATECDQSAHSETALVQICAAYTSI